MSKKLFSNEEVENLSSNRYVKEISNKGITYTDDFKVLFIAEYNNVKMPFKIFEDAGIDVEVIGNQRIWNASKRWRESYKDSGELWLRDTRKFSSGRPLKRELTQEEILAKKDAEIAYWKVEAELLRKIDLQES